MVLGLHGEAAAMPAKRARAEKALVYILGGGLVWELYFQKEMLVELVLEVVL